MMQAGEDREQAMLTTPRQLESFSDHWIAAGQAPSSLLTQAASYASEAAREYGLPADKAAMESDLGKRDVEWLLRYVGDELVAFIAFFDSGDNYLGSRSRVLVLQEVWVDSLCRKQGHAASLAEAVRKRAEEDRKSPRARGEESNTLPALLRRDARLHVGAGVSGMMAYVHKRNKRSRRFLDAIGLEAVSTLYPHTKADELRQVPAPPAATPPPAHHHTRAPQELFL